MVAYSFKRDFIDPIEQGLKTHTLRGPRRRHARVGETMQLYVGMRTKHCRLIGTGICDRFRGVLLKFSTYPAFFIFDVMESDPGVFRRKGELQPLTDLDAFARSDGFAHFDAMAKFWRDNHGPAQSWEGFLIGWSGFSKAEAA